MESRPFPIRPWPIPTDVGQKVGRTLDWSPGFHQLGLLGMASLGLECFLLKIFFCLSGILHCAFPGIEVRVCVCGVRCGPS